jgi:hypothetical protein
MRDPRVHEGTPVTDFLLDERLDKAMKTLLLMMMLLVCTVVVVHGQKVKVGADRSVDLAKYKTYTWAPERGSANPLIHQIIVDAVDQALLAKGLTKVAKDGEMTIVSLAAVEHDTHTSYPTWSPGLNSISTGIPSAAQSWPVSQGTLMVDISDTKTKSNLWRGTAIHTLDEGPSGDMSKDAKRVEKVIRKAVDKMFKQYPYPPK